MTRPFGELTKDFSKADLRHVERGTELLRILHDFFSQLAKQRGRELNDEEMAVIDEIQDVAMSKLDSYKHDIDLNQV